MQQCNTRAVQEVLDSERLTAHNYTGTASCKMLSDSKSLLIIKLMAESKKKEILILLLIPEGTVA